MPLYEYKCDACSLVFEELVFSSSAAAGVSCPRCKETRVERLLSTFAHARGDGAGESSSSSSCSRSSCTGCSGGCH